MAVHEGHIVGKILVSVEAGAGNPGAQGVATAQALRCGIGFPWSEIRPDALGKDWRIAAAHFR